MSDVMSGTNSYTGPTTIPPDNNERYEAYRRARNPYSKEGLRDIIIGDPFEYNGHQYLGIGSIDPIPTGGAWVRTYETNGDPVSRETLLERHGTDGANEVNRLSASGVEKMLNYFSELINESRSSK
jgi:hypothetical protein